MVRAFAEIWCTSAIEHFMLINNPSYILKFQYLHTSIPPIHLLEYDRYLKMSTPSTTAPQIRSLYRRLLRELPARVPSSTTPPTRSIAASRLSNPSVLQQRIRSFVSDAEEGQTKSQIQQGEQFVEYLQAQRMYATLIERYNPGMGMSEEERVRLTARRVGMDLPKEFMK